MENFNSEKYRLNGSATFLKPIKLSKHKFSNMTRYIVCISVFFATSELTFANGTNPLIDHQTAPLKQPNSTKPYEEAFERIGVKSREPGDVYRDLDLTFKDIVVPGNGGLDIVIERSYNNTSDPRFAENDSDSGWLRAAPKFMGDFWDIHLPAVIFPGTYESYLNLPSHTSKNGCQNKVQGAMGEKQPTITFYTSENGIRVTKSLHRAGSTETQFSEITTDNWKAECITSSVDGTSGRIIYSPDGKRYVFNYRPQGSGSWLLTKVTDKNGNWLQYNYGTFPAQTWALSPPNLTSITANDGRVVQFNYQTILGRPHVVSIVAPGQRIDYRYEIYQSAQAWESGLFWNEGSYSSNTQAKRTRLTSAVLADGTSWYFQYQPKEAYGLLSSVTTPSGGVISYNFQVGLLPNFQLNSRHTSGTIPVSSWFFDDINQSTPSGQYVRGPNYCEKNIFSAGGVSGSPKYNSSLWDIGLPLSNTTYSDNACTIEARKETFQYNKRQISPDYKARDCYYIAQPFTPENVRCWYGDPVTYAPVQTSHVITQDGQTYSTTVSSWDTYGNPLTVVETGSNGGNRTTNFTHYINTAKWIFQLASESFTGSSKSLSYDSNGNLTQITQDGVTTSATYDSQGNVSSITYPRGLTHYFSNYKRGKPQTETQPENISISRVIDDAGNITSETNGEGKTTTYLYDDLGRVTSVSKPLGPTQYFSYTATTKSASRGILTETTKYDGLYRPTSITLGGIATTYRYNAIGQVAFASNPGNTLGTNYEYDVLGRLKKQTNSDGTFRTITYGAAKTTVTDERGFSTTYNYRSYGDPQQQWIMSIISPDITANLTLARNSRDLVTSATQGGFTRTYGYNSNYYLTSINNPETGLTVIGRDIAGNQTSRGTGLSAVATYTYDGKNRLVNTNYPSDTPSTTNTYNKNGRLLTSNSAIANKSYSYDANSNLLTEKIDVDGLSFSTTYTYNALDQLSSVTYPRSGNTVSYSPDVLGRPTQVSGYISNVIYWRSGQIMQLNYANGTVTRYGQNSRLWPTTFSTQKSQTYYTNSNYGYDGVGNLTTISDSVDSSYNRTIGYDALSRLTSITGPWGSGSISYNGIGNINSQVFGSYGLYYNYDSNNRLSSLIGNRNATFSYDYYGNVTSDSSKTFVYDDVPNLRCANCTNTTNKILYGYDATNNRITTEKGGVKTYEVYDATGKQLIEFTPTQNKLTEYIYLGGKRIAQRVSP